MVYQQSLAAYIVCFQSNPVMDIPQHVHLTSLSSSNLLSCLVARRIRMINNRIHRRHPSSINSHNHRRIELVHWQQQLQSQIATLRRRPTRSLLPQLLICRPFLRLLLLCNSIYLLHLLLPPTLRRRLFRPDHCHPLILHLHPPCSLVQNLSPLLQKHQLPNHHNNYLIHHHRPIWVLSIVHRW